MAEEGLLGRVYKDGEIIVKEGTESREMYVIQSGKVHVIKGSGDAAVTLAVLKEGDIFGEMSLLDAQPRSATVKAVGEARVLAIDHEMFLRRVRQDPTLALRALRQMGLRVRELDRRISSTLDKVAAIQQELLRLKEDVQAKI